MQKVSVVVNPNARATAAEIAGAGFPVHFECLNCGGLFGARHGQVHCCAQPVVPVASSFYDETEVDETEAYAVFEEAPECMGHEPDPERVQGYPETVYCDGSCRSRSALLNDPAWTAHVESYEQELDAADEADARADYLFDEERDEPHSRF